MIPNIRRHLSNIGGYESEAARAIARRSISRFGRPHFGDVRKLPSVTFVEPLENRTLLASNLTITPTFDTSITSLTNATAIEATINKAIANFEADVTCNTPINVAIKFQTTTAGLADNISPTMDLAYSTYRADLVGNPNASANDLTALAHMPAGPGTGINNATQVLLTAANLAAIGDTTDANSLVTANGGFYGIVEFNLASMNITRPDSNPNNYDLQSSVTHEMDEVLGIGGYATTLYQPGATPPSSLPTDVGPLDFFRYASPGVKSFTYDPTTTAYFSIDGGNTNLVYFNQQDGSFGADFGDWNDAQGTGSNTPPQVQDAFGTPGTAPNLGTNELIGLDVVGWNLVPLGTGPTITLDPSDQTVTSGSTVTFSASAIGSPTPTVQWQVSTDGGTTFTDIPGETSTTLSFVASQSQTGFEYQAVFTNTAGSATTNPATLTIGATNAPPVIRTSPLDQNVVAGQTASFAATATGSPTPNVQWQVSTDGGQTFFDIPGATSDVLNITTDLSQNGNEYQAVFSNTAGSITSGTASLTVTAMAPSYFITLQPVNQNVISGQTVQFIAAAGDTVSPDDTVTSTVQWQVSTDQTNYTNIPGATSSAYDFTAVSQDSGNSYRAVFTSSLGTATSNGAFLAVSAIPGTSSVTAPSITSSGGSAQTITVVYTGTSAAINPSTVSGADITVTAPNNQVLAATVFNIALSGDSATVTYLVHPTDGAWQAADNGSYSVIVGAGSVKDINGVGVGGSFTTFTVSATTPLVLDLFSSDASTLAGQPTTFTATLLDASGATPTGTVTFFSDGFPIGTATVGGNGTASLVANSLYVGTHAVTAVYSGDTTYPAVASNTPVLQTVTPSLTSIVPAIAGALPAFAVVGAKTSIKQTVTIASTDQGAFNGKVTVKIYLAFGSSLDPGAYLLAAKAKTYRVKNHQSPSMQLNLAGIPASAVPGTYHLVTVLTDASGHISATSSSGPLMVEAPLTDLAATSLSLPGSVALGHTVGGTLVVTNHGNVRIKGRLVTVFHSSSSGLITPSSVELKSDYTQINLAPGESAPIQVNNLPTPLTTGTSFIVADIDPANAFNNVNQANNLVASNPIVVT